ncbi:hypothetical protein NDA14_005860 [Ustilago hordei]|uniref:Uncharacterized protein n=1 Tax=Ustilago hordei TaxID=120017 RepID=I2FZ17_USTHO|nr:uncharacterized protein UHO2_06764 [Ustilago hordei]KAJ1577013.1 hypothetical protein NDA15_005177 [Ustilago hordei]KAJ1578501.1 hypothetical protein NDA12_000736 [Ustilago hordei]KAJ1599278.1 hypothetical protein NDA14_005860 [Ustilago hordei]UTT91175.1 hypothetical protein NDA17_004384 [Ustilago hordei]CCF52160.1 uncharacterized protein UHOR_15310 [Ustilago hordei]
MSNHDYSAYEDFVQDAEDIIHHLPPKLQGCFHRMITNKAYGMPEELKDRVERTNLRLLQWDKQQAGSDTTHYLDQVC